MEVNRLSDRRHEYHVSSMMFDADCGIMDIVGEVGELCSFQPPTHQPTYGELRRMGCK